MLKPKYLAPSPSKPKKTRIVLLVVFLLLIGIGSFYFIHLNKLKEKEPVKSYNTICSYSVEKTKKIFSERPEYPFLDVANIFFYGESLNITKNPYQVGEKDELNGKTITLINLCTQEQFSFLSSSQLDINVLTYTLPEGFYEVLVEDNFVFHHISTVEKTEIDFYSITRNKQSKHYRIFSDKDFFIDPENDQPLLRKHALFIEIKDEESQNLDIIIDAVGYDQDFNRPNTGIQIDENFNTAQVSYKMALDLKSKLESHGLKVGLTREVEDVFVNTYGEKGRVYQALDQKAKLMIQLDFAQIENAMNRSFMVTSSNYASRSLGTLLADAILANSKLKYETQRGFNGSVLPQRLKQLDRQNLIRESGGLSLGAGTYSDLSARTNQFAKDNIYGVQTVSISFGNMKNETQRQTFEQEYEQILNDLVAGLLKYLRIESS